MDGYLQQKFHRTVTAVEKYSYAGYLFAAILQQLSVVPPSNTPNDVRRQLIHYMFHSYLNINVSYTENNATFCLLIFISNWKINPIYSKHLYQFSIS